MKKLYTLIALFCLGTTLLAAAPEKTPVTGADGLKRATPESQGVPAQAIADLFKAIDQKDYQVHSLMLIRHGYVIAEHWWDPYRAEEPHAMYSATKTFSGTAIGFAVQEGLLRIEDKVISFFPDMLPDTISPQLAKLTVRHLLTMSAGHAGTQYAGSGNAQIKSFLAADFAHEPGEVFAYNITCSHMLSNIITRVTGLSLYEYLKPRLLDPLGIKDIEWEMDMDGRNMGNGGLHLRTSDMAKMGLFLLGKGAWNGKQLMDSQWIEAATTPHIFQHPERTTEENSKDDGSQGYGYQIWMGRNNSFRAIGASSQLIMVIPEYDFVAVSTASVGDENGFNSLLYALLPQMSDKPLKPVKGFDLNAQLSQYVLDRPFDAGDASAKVTSCTRRYVIQQNNLGIEQVSFRFDAEGNCTLTLESAGALHNIPFGLNVWKMGHTDRKLQNSRSVYANTMNTSPVTTAGICSWGAVNELNAHYLSMFNVNATETFKFVFSGNELKMTVVAPQTPQRPGQQQTASRDIVLRGLLQ